jgi:hypothetical protein
VWDINDISNIPLVERLQKRNNFKMVTGEHLKEACHQSGKKENAA